MSSNSKPQPTTTTNPSKLQDTQPLIHRSNSHRRPGKSLMTAPPDSLDPSTAALVAWAEDKQQQHPGANGSFGNGSTTGMSWGAESWVLPHKGDTPLPPDQGKPEIVGGEADEGGMVKEGEKKEDGKWIRFSGLFKRMEKK